MTACPRCGAVVGLRTDAEERAAILRLARRLVSVARQAAERAGRSDRRYLDAQYYESEADGIDRLVREIEAGAHHDPIEETP